jgi:hypothetical protein
MPSPFQAAVHTAVFAFHPLSGGPYRWTTMQEVAAGKPMLTATSECSSVNEGHFEASDTISIRRDDTQRPGSPTTALTLRPIVPETFQRYTRGRTMCVDSKQIFNVIVHEEF